ncbi:25314_t:CDS:1, partial [Gigaspora rosea]
MNDPDSKISLPDDITVDDNKIDLESFFEAAQRGSLDVDTLNENIETVTIVKDQQFDDFNQAKKHIRNYAEYKSFKVIMGRSTSTKIGENKKIMRKRTIYCYHFGKYQPANPEKPGKTIRKGYQWHINLPRPLKQNPNSLVYVITFLNEHNHDMCPKALQFEKLKAFTKEMQDDIEFYLKQCHFGATIIRQILKKKYTLYPVYSKDLYTEIQKHRSSTRFNEGDAARSIKNYWQNSVITHV